MYAYERIDVMQNCCLWIGGVKVSDLDGIRDNFNITDVKGYYLGGRLADWLRLGGYDNEAARIDNIDRNGDVDKALEDIFTGSAEESDSDNKDSEYGGYHFKTVTPPFLKREAGTVVLSADGSFRFPVMTGSGYLPVLSRHLRLQGRSVLISINMNTNMSTARVKRASARSISAVLI